MLLPGDRAPYFKVASSVNPNFNFDTIAGRYVVLSFFGSSRYPASARLLSELADNAQEFDGASAAFFGVSVDPDDFQRLEKPANGIVYFWDFELAVSAKYGVIVEEPPGGAGDAPHAPGPTSGAPAALTNAKYRPQSFVLDQSLRIVAIIPYTDDGIGHLRQIREVLSHFPPLQTLNGRAPVLVVPYVFEPELCQRLIDYYKTRGGSDSGFMRDQDGKTVGVYDYAHKRRMDCEIFDDALIRATHERMQRRLVPAIRQAYQFNVTRIERHIVACYDAAQGAHFRAHRDNTTLGTAHRRFAVTINLNSDEYEGGEIWFPEFGRHKYKAPSGSAIVFSCSLLHEVPKVTRGKRYAFLPFLYDDAAAAIRAQNHKYLSDLSTGGAAPTQVCDSAPRESDGAKSQLTGEAGCGNPEGCGTCLSAATYQLGVLGKPSPMKPESSVESTSDA